MLAELGVTSPALAAPMAGGPSTPELVVAAAGAGGLGFLAAGYLAPDALTDRIAAVRARTPVFGVNLFAPPAVPVDPAAYRAYAAELGALAERFGVALPTEPVEDDDGWAAKLDLLIADPVPVLSFTFGIPDAAVVARLRRAGTLTVQTVTSPAEARLAAAAGVDLLAVQAASAGGHSATLTPTTLPPDVPLPELLHTVRAVTALPLLAAGGINSPAAVAAALHAGASSVLVGTALLRSPEAGTSAVHRAALAEHERSTVRTHAFSGRPARALRNSFVERFDALAPLGYPAIHHLTSGLRKAAAAAGDPEHVHLWAGAGFRDATDEPAATILTRLASTA